MEDPARQPLLLNQEESIDFGDEPIPMLSQPAVKAHRHFHPATQQFESLDYDPYDSSETMKHASGKSSMDKLMAVLCLFAVGVVTALCAIFMMFAIKSIQGLKYEWLQHMIDDGEFIRPLFAYWGVNLVLAGSILLAVVFIEPRMGGGGTPEVVAYLNCINMPKVVRLKTLIGKIVGTILSVSANMAMGPEAPIIQVGAIIGAGLPQGKASSFKLDTGLFRSFRNDHDKLEFIACGIAAGFSAAFGAPIAGVLIVLEEGASFWDQNLILRTFVCALAAKFTFALFIAGMFTGNLDAWGLFNLPGFLFFGTMKTTLQRISIANVLLYILVGVLCGLVGAAFNYSAMKINEFRTHYVNNRKWLRVVEGLFMISLTSIVFFLTPHYIKTCRVIQPGAEEIINAEFRRWNCPEGHYSVMATLFLNGLDDGVKHLWFNYDHFPLWHLLLFCVLWGILMNLSLGIALPGGLLIPTLLVGGALGRFVGQIAELLPWDFDAHLVSLVGSAAFLSGTTRLTVTVVAIIIESTNEFVHILPLIFACLIAKWVGDLLTVSLIEVMIEVRGAPFLEWSPPHEYDKLRTCDIMQTEVKCLSKKETIQNIEQLLESSIHNAFPVVRVRNELDNPPHSFGTLCGIISRRALVSLVNKTTKPTAAELKVGSADAQLPRVEWKVDLTPHINRWPYTLGPTATLTRAFQLFRLMGLRHLIITDKNNRVVGIITRKDLVHWEVEDHDTEDEHGGSAAAGDAQLGLNGDYAGSRESSATVRFDVEEGSRASTLNSSLNSSTDGTQPAGVSTLLRRRRGRSYSIFDESFYPQTPSSPNSAAAAVPPSLPTSYAPVHFLGSRINEHYFSDEDEGENAEDSDDDEEEESSDDEEIDRTIQKQYLRNRPGAAHDDDDDDARV